jgi:cytochrome c biogenesis protein CcdA
VEILPKYVLYKLIYMIPFLTFGADFNKWANLVTKCKRLTDRVLLWVILLVN